MMAQAFDQHYPFTQADLLDDALRLSGQQKEL